MFQKFSSGFLGQCLVVQVTELYGGLGFVHYCSGFVRIECDVILLATKEYILASKTLISVVF